MFSFKVIPRFELVMDIEYITSYTMSILAIKISIGYLKMRNSKAKQAISELLLSSATDLTLADRRLYNYLLHYAFTKLTKQLHFEISLTELAGVYGSGLPPIDRLKESLRRLIRTLIQFKREGRWIAISLLEKIELDENKAILLYSYPVHCQTLFTDPFILERCLIQAHFMQKYSNLLYEILSEIYYAKQNVISLEISDLRSRLLIQENKLSNYSDLDRFVLTPAINEINSYASFAVKFHTERKGMKVTHVVFEITGKSNLLNIEDAKEVIPPKRPRLFIDNPEAERAYAYLLNAETPARRKYFNLAIKQALKKKIIIEEDQFDRPDLWFKWVEEELIKK
jgi:hypothetical protein